MKYRCFFCFTTQKTLGPCYATVDIKIDGSIAKTMIPLFEKHFKEDIEKDQGCEVHDFILAAWSEIAEEEKINEETDKS